MPSALIELLLRSEASFPAFASQLADLTAQKSHGFQPADVLLGAQLPRLTIRPKPIGETRVALVIVFSDYSLSGGVQSLPGSGAKNDIYVARPR